MTSSHLPFAVKRRRNFNVKARLWFAELNGLERTKRKNCYRCLIHFHSTHPQGWACFHLQFTRNRQIRVEKIFKLGAEFLHVFINFVWEEKHVRETLKRPVKDVILMCHFKRSWRNFETFTVREDLESLCTNRPREHECWKIEKRHSIMSFGLKEWKNK